jgi:formylglycine-generating enzyme required for sulfatase activity
MKKSNFFAIAIWIILSLALAGVSIGAERGIKVQRIKDLNHESGKLGEYKALIIGINDYKGAKIPDLETPINDAKAIAKVLKEKYGFKVELLLDRNATKRAIFRGLRRLAKKTQPNDSVLIYFAGHGALDKTYDDGWWIPADATGGDPFTYLDNGEVQKAMKSMKARHVLLISDSCYSGTLFGKARSLPPLINDKYYLSLYNEKSRWGMTSGNKTPVSDQGTGGHSVFAYQLIKELERNDKPFISTQEIHTRIAPVIGNNSEQTPLCRPVRHTGDQGGQFVFVASIKKEPPPTAPKAKQGTLDKEMLFWQSIQDSDSPALFEEYIERFPNGFFASIARQKIEALKQKTVIASIPAKASKSHLFVEIEPKDAGVRILNIKPKFQQGMNLDPGRYHVEVSAEGYEPDRRWVTLSAGEDENISVRLDPVKTATPAPAPVSPQPKGAFTNRLGMKFVYIKPGSFMMGSSLSPSEVAAQYGWKEEYYKDEHPQHRVTLTKGFYMQSMEVTVGQWREFARGSGYKSEAETGGGVYVWTGEKFEKKAGVFWDNPGFSQTDANPVTCVSWNDAQAFAKWLSREDGGDYRLPTEAEWEYAARAGTRTPFYTGDCLSTGKANYRGNYPGKACSKGTYRQKTTAVGTFSPNPWGLYNMHGNVNEWCQDWFKNYSSGSVTDPTGPSSGAGRVFRGGSWYDFAWLCRSAYRSSDEPGYRDSRLGFRLARAQ